MTVTDVQTDEQALTLRITAEYDAPVERAWQLWSDPRQLERWWGPPTYPATFVDHDLSPGASVTYFMTSPEGEKHHGWWKIVSVDAPSRLEFEDGFGQSYTDRNPGMPVSTMVASLDERPGGGTVMTVLTTYSSSEAMEQLVKMGMVEGMTAAMGQIDAILGEAPAAT
jgi:uncharacterized protein YndB with AHSA1/START domain